MELVLGRVSPFVMLTGIICTEYAKYIELINEFLALHRQKHENELIKQHLLYQKHLEIHKCLVNYSNSIYEFKSMLTSDLEVKVNYLDIVGIFIPNTYSTVYLQASFDGDDDVSVTMSLNNQWYFNVGGLPEGTIIFTPNSNYIIEGDELVKFKS